MIIFYNIFGIFWLIMMFLNLAQGKNDYAIIYEIAVATIMILLAMKNLNDKR